MISFTHSSSGARYQGRDDNLSESLSLLSDASLRFFNFTDTLGKHAWYIE